MSSSLLASLQQGGDYIKSIENVDDGIKVTKGDNSEFDINIQGNEKLEEEIWPNITEDPSISYDLRDFDTEYNVEGSYILSGVYDLLIIGAGGGADASFGDSGGDGGVIASYKNVVFDNVTVEASVGRGSRGGGGTNTVVSTSSVGSFTAEGAPSNGDTYSERRSYNSYTGDKTKFKAEEVVRQTNLAGNIVNFNGRRVQGGGSGGNSGIRYVGSLSAQPRGGGDPGGDGEDGTGGGGGSDEGTPTKGGDGDIIFVRRRKSKIYTMDGRFVVTEDIECNNLIETSDVRLKKDIRNLIPEESLQRLLKIQGKTFKKKNDNNDRTYVGYIAQDVKHIIPEIVHYNEEKDVYGIMYADICSVLSESIKALNNKCELLADQVKLLKNNELDKLNKSNDQIT